MLLSFDSQGLEKLREINNKERDMDRQCMRKQLLPGVNCFRREGTRTSVPKDSITPLCTLIQFHGCTESSAG